MKKAASITMYFPSSLLIDPINTIVDDLINLEEVIEKEGFNLALEELNTLHISGFVHPYCLFQNG